MIAIGTGSASKRLRISSSLRRTYGRRDILTHFIRFRGDSK